METTIAIILAVAFAAFIVLKLAGSRKKDSTISTPAPAPEADPVGRIGANEALKDSK